MGTKGDREGPYRADEILMVELPFKDDGEIFDDMDM